MKQALELCYCLRDNVIWLIFSEGTSWNKERETARKGLPLPAPCSMAKYSQK